MGFDGSDLNKGVAATNRNLQSLDSQIRKTGASGSPGLDRVQRDALKTSNSLRSLSSQLGSLQGTLGTLSEAFTIGLTVPLALVGRAAFNAYRDLDNTRRGMEAVLGSGAKATAYLEQLRELARSPGLDFKSTTDGFRRLVASGIDTNTATAALKEFGNALALVGGNSEDLSGVALALQQIASKTKVSAEEINQIAERVPSIRKLITQAFGTADTEKLQKMGILPKDFIKAVVREAESLPRATSGVANEMKNIRDDIYKTLTEIGDDIATVILPYLKTGAGYVRDFAKAFRELDPATREAIVRWSLMAAALGGLFYTLNMIRGVIKAGIDLYGMMANSISLLLPKVGAETLAVNAEAAAYQRLAVAKTEAAVAGDAGVFSGVPSKGMSAGGVRALAAQDDIVRSRQAVVDRLMKKVIAQQAYDTYPAGMAAVGSTGGNIASMLKKAEARLAEAQSERRVTEILVSGQLIPQGEKTISMATRLAAAVRSVAAAIMSPTGLAIAAGAAVAGLGAILLKSSGVAEMNERLAHKYDAVNSQLGLTSGLTDKVADAQGRLITRFELTSQRIAEINKGIAEQQRLANIYYETVDIDPKAGRAIMHPGRDGKYQMVRPKDVFNAVTDYVGNPQNKLTPPAVDEAKKAADTEAVKAAKNLRDDLQQKLEESRLKLQIAQNGGIMNPIEKLRRERAAERAAIEREKGAAFGKDARELFDVDTATQAAAATIEMKASVKKIIDEARVTVKKELEDLGKDMTESLEFNTKKLEDKLGENIKATSTHYQTILNANLDSRQAANDAQQSRDIEQIDMYVDASVKGQLSAEQQKLEITKKYAQKRLEIELQRIDLQYVDEISAAKDTTELRRVLDEIDAKKTVARDKVNADIEEASKDSAVRQAKVVRDEYLRQFDAVKNGAGQIFDALVTKTQSFGDAIKNILKTALLTPLREFASTWIATVLTGGNPRAGGQQQQSRGGILGGIFGSIMNGGSMSGGGMGPTTPPFIPIMSGARAPAALGGSYGIAGLGSMGMAGLPGLPGMGGGAAGGSGAAGSIWQASGLAQYGGMLTKLGNLGAGTGMKANGIAGMKGGGMLLGGGILAADGLRRGGLLGLGETTAGGALIGMKFGGVPGAIIGGAIGFAAGFARLFKKGSEDKVRQAIKNAYGVDIPDKAILKQIWGTAKQSFGGNIATAIQSKEIRELVQLYASSTGQTYRGPATETQQTTLIQGGGSIYQAPGIGSLGQTLPSFGGSIPMLGGVVSAGSGYGQPVVLNIQLDGQSTEQVMRGEAIQVIADNPRAIASSLSDAASQNYDRRDTAITSLTPGLLTA